MGDDGLFVGCYGKQHNRRQKHLPKTDKTYHRNICKTPKTTEEMLKITIK